MENTNLPLEQAHNEQKTANKTATKKIVSFLVGLAVIGGAYGAYYKLYASHYETTENAYVSGIQNTVTSQVAGNIIEIQIQDSQQVKKGQLAVKIDPVDYQLNLERAENELARSIRNFKSLEINKTQNKDLVSLKLVDLQKAQDDYLKDSLAFNAGVLSKEKLDNTKHILEQAKIALNDAKLSLANSTVQVLAKNIYEHPDVAKAITQYKTAYLDLERTKITVPTDGVIAKKSVYLGQRVSPNQTLFSVVDVNNEWVDANLKESQLRRVSIGQKVEMESDVNGKTYSGVVAGIGAGSGSSLSLLPAQNATGNWIKVVQRVPVRIQVDKQSLQENGTLPIGTSMRIQINLDEKSGKVDSFYQDSCSYLDNKRMEDNIDKIIQKNLYIK